MWAVEEPGWLFTPSTIGNQAWDRHEGARVVDGSVSYPIEETGTSVIAVVGHTGCGAVSTALREVREDNGMSLSPGVRKWIDLLVPVVEAGLDDSRLSRDSDVSIINQLVEYNVDRQVRFLCESPTIPESVAVYGFVYDFQRIYGENNGRIYLVNSNGITDPKSLRDELDQRYHHHVKRLLV